METDNWGKLCWQLTTGSTFRLFFAVPVQQVINKVKNDILIELDNMDNKD